MPLIDREIEIEMLALRGKAVAAMLGIVATTSDSSPEELSMGAYALECYFDEILAQLARA